MTTSVLPLATSYWPTGCSPSSPPSSSSGFWGRCTACLAAPGSEEGGFFSSAALAGGTLFITLSCARVRRRGPLPGRRAAFRELHARRRACLHGAGALGVAVPLLPGGRLGDDHGDLARGAGDGRGAEVDGPGGPSGRRAHPSALPLAAPRRRCGTSVDSFDLRTHADRLEGRIRAQTSRALAVGAGVLHHVSVHAYDLEEPARFLKALRDGGDPAPRLPTSRCAGCASATSSSTSSRARTRRRGRTTSAWTWTTSRQRTKRWRSSASG